MAPRRLTRLALLLASTFAVASCSPHASGNSGGTQALSGAQLKNRLLSGTTLPPGLQVMLEATAQDNPGAASASADPCADLVDAYRVVTQTDAPAATARVSFRASKGSPWMPSERLSRYQADGAHKVLAEIRSLVQRCPTYADGPLTTRFSVADGPKLGDESLRLQARTPSQVPGADTEADAIVIRSGSLLLVVSEIDATPEASKLADLADAAYTKLTVSKP